MTTDTVSISAPTVQASLLALLRVGGCVATVPVLAVVSIDELLPNLKVLALPQIRVSHAN